MPKKEVAKKKVTEKRTECLQTKFFEMASGKQPVKEFITKLPKDGRREIGADIRAVQRDFPRGLPLVKKVAKDLWEIRSTTKYGICRVFFAVLGEKMVLLHAFMKKTQKTPAKETDVANERLKEFKEMQKQGAKKPV